MTSNAKEEEEPAEVVRSKSCHNKGYTPFNLKGLRDLENIEIIGTNREQLKAKNFTEDNYLVAIHNSNRHCHCHIKPSSQRSCRRNM